MIKDRSELEEEIERFMKLHFADREITDKIKKYMTEKNYNLGEVNMMINLNSSPVTLTEIDLGVLAAAITYAGGFDYKKYFQPNELRSIDDYYKEYIKEKVNKVVFTEAFQLTEHQYLSHVSISDLVRWLQEDHIITYNPNIQRELIRKVNKNGELIETIHLNKGKQNKIARRIVKGQQYADTLFFNLLDNGLQKEPVYDGEKHTLSIEFDENTELAITDGFHRLMACVTALGIDSTVDLNYAVIISFLDEAHAGDLVQQEDMHTPIKRAKAKLLGSSNPYIQMAKVINAYGNEVDNELYHRFGEDEAELKLKPDKLCSFDTFSKAIEYNFFNDKKPSGREIQHVREFLISGFNEVIGIFKDKYGDSLEEIKKKGVQLNPNMFIGYIALLSKLYKNKEWRAALELELSNMDFTTSNNVWKTINLFAPKVNKSVVKKISSYFVERGV